ncbi:hypothetical protein ACFW04_002671 [Cataglyphis niger]
MRFNMQFLLLLPIILNVINISTAWRTFLRGRSKYGNLGEPILSSKTYVLPEEQWFTQHLDHFNPTDARIWKQKYFVNSNFYKPNGPIFLMIGAEGLANAKWMVEGQWIEYAKEFGAMCFYLEHRYYGKSHPTPDLSVKNLIYLSSQQALADLAYFIHNINIGYKFSNDTKWIVFGGSYGGSLAAWMRAKYPHLVHGAVSTSGPLLAQIDFQGRQWMYQTCTEFGFFQTSTANPNLFSNAFPVKFFIQQCIDIFGPRYDIDLLKSAVTRTNILYGALNLQVTNVVFVHGSVDPWHVLGITTSSNPQAPAIYINGTAHCADMYPSSENDIPQLKEARIQIKDLIKQWLKNL